MVICTASAMNMGAITGRTAAVNLDFRADGDENRPAGVQETLSLLPNRREVSRGEMPA
jgi:hypothetical protein